MIKKKIYNFINQSGICMVVLNCGDFINCVAEGDRKC